MDTIQETPVVARPGEVLVASSKQTNSRSKAVNTFKFREEWLASAVQMLRPMFDKAGAAIPDLGRAAIGFTSRGGKGNCVGECWHSTASADAHFEIFIRPDNADPIEVLGILVHELVHSALPLGSGHGPTYKALALKIGLEGKMRHAMPGMHLIEILKGIAAELGPLPHAALNIQFRESAPRKKQKTNLLKAWCEGVKDAAGKVTEPCDCVYRVTATHAKKAAPICGIHELRMKVEWPAEDENDDEEAVIEAETAPVETEKSSFKASPPETEASFKAPAAPVEPSPGYRFTTPDEVHPPGQTFKMNVETGQTEVLIPPVLSPTNEDSHA